DHDAAIAQHCAGVRTIGPAGDVDYRPAVRAERRIDGAVARETHDAPVRIGRAELVYPVRRTDDDDAAVRLEQDVVRAIDPRRHIDDRDAVITEARVECAVGQETRHAEV